MQWITSDRCAQGLRVCLRTILCAQAGLLLTLAPACSSGGGGSPAESGTSAEAESSSPAPSSGSSSTPAGATKPEIPSLSMDDAFDNVITGDIAGDAAALPEGEGSPPRANSGRTVSIEDAPAEGSTEREPGAGTETAESEPEEEPGGPARAEQYDRSRLTHELASRLRAAAAEDPAQTLPALIRLAALETVEPGVLNSHFTGLGNASGASVLAEEEREALLPLRDAMAEVGQALRDENADPVRALTEAVHELDEKLVTARPLEIDEARLCTVAEGYGKYEEFPTYGGVYKFIFGRARRMVVYADVENYVSREATRNGRSGYEVSLVQDLRLYHASKDTDTLAWIRKDQEVADFCRRKRDDFYIAHLIELPETLSVGSYRLKVRVTDEHSERAAAEAVIPIEIVGDTSALRDTGRVASGGG